MISGKSALIIAGIGSAIIVIYTFYLVLRLNCRLDTKISRSECPKCPECPGTKATSNAVAEHNATVLVKRLMNSARKATKDRKGSVKDYHSLLQEIYRKFTELNAKIIDKDEQEMSQKFLAEIRKEIKEQKGGKAGKVGSVNESDIARVLNENEHAIYQVYPSLK